MTIKVFIADDHVFMREGLAQLLQTNADIEVVGTAGNGRTTLSEVLRLKPDVVIMDISMPDMNGIEATRQIRAAAPDCRVIILSMHSTTEHVFHSMEAGAAGFLLKESQGSEIVSAVLAVHAGRRFLSPQVSGVLDDPANRSRGVSPLSSLSQREREILQLVVEGNSSAQIATVLAISPKTVDTYRSRLMQKLAIGDVAGLVKFAIQHGLTPPA